MIPLDDSLPGSSPDSRTCICCCHCGCICSCNCGPNEAIAERVTLRNADGYEQKNLDLYALANWQHAD